MVQQCGKSSALDSKTAAQVEPVAAAGELGGELVEQPRAGADVQRRNPRGGAGTGLGREEAHPRGPPKIDQQTVFSGMFEQDPLGQRAQRPALAALSQVASREGIDDADAGRLGQPGRIAQREVMGTRVGGGPQPGIVDADDEDLGGRRGGFGAQLLDHFDLDFGEFGPELTEGLDGDVGFANDELAEPGSQRIGNWQPDGRADRNPRLIPAPGQVAQGASDRLARRSHRQTDRGARGAVGVGGVVAEGSHGKSRV